MWNIVKHNHILTRGYWTLKGNSSVSQTQAHPCSFADADARANPGLGPSVRKRTLKICNSPISSYSNSLISWPSYGSFSVCLCHSSSSKTGWGKAWEEGKMCNFRGWEFNYARLQFFEPATWTLLSLWKLYHRHTQDWPYHFAHFSLVAKQQTNNFLKWLYSSYLPVTHLPRCHICRGPCFTNLTHLPGVTFVGGPALQNWHSFPVSHL